LIQYFRMKHLIRFGLRTYFTAKGGLSCHLYDRQKSLFHHGSPEIEEPAERQALQEVHMGAAYPTIRRNVVTPEGLEPSTRRLRVVCSAKLSYGATGILL
jgi:hypothetical protein